MKPIKFYLIIIVFLITFCSENFKRKPLFFIEYEKYWPEDCYISIDSVFSNDSICGYKTWFFDGPSQYNYLLKGIIIEEKNIIFFISDPPFNIKFILFDFNLKVGDNKLIQYSRRLNNTNIDTNYTKKYNLKLDTIFFDSVIGDSIYKFKFENFKVFDENNNFIYFVGKKAGIVGCYLNVTNNIDSSEEIIGRIRGNVYENIFDYSKARFGTIK